MKELHMSNKDSSLLNKLKVKIKSIDLLDGQRRGEIIFRRVVALVLGALLVYWLLLVLVGEKEGSVEGVEKIEPEEIVEVVEWKEGDRVTYKPDGEIEVVPAEVFMDSSILAVREFTREYRGSRIDDEYFNLLDKYCSDEALRTVVAISVAESGMGRDVSRQSNFFGWFKNGNSAYDPDRETMAKEICRGVEENYLGIGNDMGKVEDYVGSVSKTWLYNFRWAYAQMEDK